MDSNRLLDKKALMERWGISLSQLERMKARQELPPHIEISGRVHRWKEEDVEQWEASKKGGL